MIQPNIHHEWIFSFIISVRGNYMQFHTILKESLTITHTKLKVLSKAVGIDPSYLSRFSNGILLPSRQIIKPLSESLGNFFYSYDEIKEHFDVKSEKELVELFQTAYESSKSEQKAVLKFKQPEFTDYLSLIIELRELSTHIEQSDVLVNCPPHLLSLIKQVFPKCVVRDSINQFIYIPKVAYFALQPFEQFQKVMVTRFSESYQLKEIELCLAY